MAKEPKVAVPKEAQVMTAILKDMGITDYEPGVVNQMLEFTYRYVSQILDDARVYANYAKKIKTIEMDDVKLAVHMQMEKSFTTPPPRDLLLDLARTRNANPLPAIKANQQGIRLPPDRYCLSACNYRLKPSRKKISSLSSGLSGGNRMSLGGSGAGMKIAATPIKPTISMVTTKTGNTQTVTLVQKPTTGIPSGPTQKIVSVNRPVFKVTPGPPGGSTPKIQLSSGNNSLAGNVMVNVSSASGVKMESDSSSFKRKREEDDYDSVQ
ncbi:transcription initiation factor TFIID subunit 9 [Procambarus clarkii]|uniref:transcription initiation factor TFIID subunit 9 n=1 Tax=Procambarus clarkii TaxID=6728 RepID=UPI001E67370B|nr:transcription initiation factor TFIID subunit 9-like [Procambarus clarkii]